MFMGTFSRSPRDESFIESFDGIGPAPLIAAWRLHRTTSLETSLSLSPSFLVSRSAVAAEPTVFHSWPRRNSWPLREKP
jgi:hypothetical protein